MSAAVISTLIFASPGASAFYQGGANDSARSTGVALQELRLQDRAVQHDDQRAAVSAVLRRQLVDRAQAAGCWTLEVCQRLAAKRLHLLGKRERRIVALLVRIHKLRAGTHDQQRPSGAAPPAHLSGWLCLHNGAYPGAPHEGRGRNGPYSGPLQMTSPWMGHYPPGGSWDNLSDSAVYSIAERVAARYGFSSSFLGGQWPNTYPPCAGRF